MGNGKLYLIPSEISPGTGQQTINNQVAEAIRECNYFLTENIRTARRYISSLKLDITIESLNFEVLDKKTDKSQLKELLKPLFLGSSIGVLSEAGCPGVADPGALAVEVAHQHQIQVVPLVGPSSILLALMGSGFNGQSFVFHGYLPIDKKERTASIRKLEKEAAKLHQTQIFMDTPYRNQHLFDDLLQTCANNTLLSVAKVITGENEEIRTMTIAQWKNVKIALHKIPVIFSLYVR
ncbi:MAG: SAM-dependent methyltransferase [Cyclobacteriaceae bacterium]